MRETAVKRISFFLEFLMLYEVYKEQALAEQDQKKFKFCKDTAQILAKCYLNDNKYTHI